MKTENSQEFFAFPQQIRIHANGSPEDMLEGETNMQKIVKCKPVNTAKGKFDLVEVFLRGDALMYWHEFKQVEIEQASKNPNGMDMILLGMCNLTFTM
eukprot:6484970-Ditylum_brightwellii.AAC.1